MPYPDLPPNPTFWRCPHCGYEERFRASGVGHITCTNCGRPSTADQLLDAHRKAHPESASL